MGHERIMKQRMKTRRTRTVLNEIIIKQRMKTVRPKLEPCGTPKNYEARNEDEKNKN